MNPIWAMILFASQGLALAVDEFVFHRSREMPRWERLGHPLDTLSLLVCLGVTLCLPAQAPWEQLYFGLALFSCLFVTKDEWVHKQFCQASEQWLHAVLFILHPVLLWVIYSLWKNASDLSLRILQLEAGLAFLFMVYQLVYWNGPWQKKALR